MINKIQGYIERDHRKIGKYLRLYHIQEESPGMVFWHNSGLIIFQEIESFIRIYLKKYKYKEVRSPLMIDKKLWEKTGHWDYYSKYIFTTSSENRNYCIKPMNCLGHIQLFNNKLNSYKDFPIKIAEFGYCHRNEPSGSLYGLMRVRGFTQDDAHIFCTIDQLKKEINDCIKMIYDIYNTFGFSKNKIFVKLSTRPKKYIGTQEDWKKAEEDLIYSLVKNNIKFEFQKGEGAFYGPKIEFTLLDCINRFWQCGTIQIDFSLPNRLGSFYIDKNNKKITPVIIHRAILGSIERFIGIITEEFAGNYPTWLAPIQVVILNITQEQILYVKKLNKKLLNLNIRTKLDIRNKNISYKIRDHISKKIPYMIICGNKEMKSNKITLRTSKGKQIEQIEINNMIRNLKKEIENRYLYQMGE